MAQNKRAGINEMRGVADKLEYTFGTSDDEQLVKLGRWDFIINSEGEGEFFDLPPLPADATARQRRDDRYAQGLRLNHPAFLLRALMTARRAIERAITIRGELISDGYAPGGPSMVRKLASVGELLIPQLAEAVKTTMAAEARVAEVRRTLAAEQIANELEDEGFMAALGLMEADAKKAKQAELEADSVKAAVAGVQRAVFDVAVVQALKPLTNPERAIVMDGRALPEQLADPRVLAAIFRAPSALLPLKRDELQAVARMAFAMNWPRTFKVAGWIEEAVPSIRETLGEAIYRTGGLLSDKPLDAFSRIPAPGGAWALEPMARHMRAAQTALAALNA